MVPISDFFPRVIPHVAGCSEPLAAQAILDSAIEFCRTSLAVQEVLEPRDVVAGRAVYDAELPPAQSAAAVMQAWFKGKPLAPVPAGVAPAVPSLADEEPRCFEGRYDAERFAIVLTPTPTRTEPRSLVLKLALRPTRKAEKLAAPLLEDWAEPVVAGALGRLHSMPGQPFTDVAKGQMLLAQARMLALQAAVEAEGGRIRTSMRVAPLPFVGGRQWR